MFIIFFLFQIAEGFWSCLRLVVSGVKMAVSFASLLFSGASAQVPLTLTPSPTRFEMVRDVDLQAGSVLNLSLVLSL